MSDGVVTFYGYDPTSKTMRPIVTGKDGLILSTQKAFNLGDQSQNANDDIIVGNCGLYDQHLPTGSYTTNGTGTTFVANITAGVIPDSATGRKYVCRPNSIGIPTSQCTGMIIRATINFVNVVAGFRLSMSGVTVGFTVPLFDDLILGGSISSVANTDVVLPTLRVAPAIANVSQSTAPNSLYALVCPVIVIPPNTGGGTVKIQAYLTR